jgi:hypothetical protein
VTAEDPDPPDLPEGVYALRDGDLTWVFVHDPSAEPVWERCQGPCGREYAYPHLCRAHMLCGLCHPGEEGPQ